MPAPIRDRTWAATLLADGWEGILEKKLAPVAVAVLDSGIDSTHPDLTARVKGAAAVELDEGNPVVLEKPLPANNDAFGHGTSVAGIIAAIAPNAEIYDLRVLSTTNMGTTKALLAGFDYALHQPWRLLNMSLAAVSTIRGELMDRCERAYYQEQIIVASRRNVPIEDDGFPASLSACIGVDRGGYPTPFEYTFRSRTLIEFEARGEEVTAPARGGGYTTMTGTSFATPTICGLCALLLGAYPDMTPFEMKAALRALALK